MSTLLNDVSELLSDLEGLTVGGLRDRLSTIKSRVDTVIKDHNPHVLKIGRYKYHTFSRILTDPYGQEVRLTNKEDGLLQHLYERRGQIVDSYKMVEAVWKRSSYHARRSMDVYIARVRKLFANDPSVKILNIHGEGFQLVIPQHNEL